MSSFLITLNSKNTDHIINPDIIHSTLNISLCKMIISIESWSDIPTYHFHRVKPPRKGNNIVFSSLPLQATTVRLAIDRIILYIRSAHDNEALEFFVPDAILAKAD